MKKNLIGIGIMAMILSIIAVMGIFVLNNNTYLTEQLQKQDKDSPISEKDDAYTLTNSKGETIKVEPSPTKPPIQDADVASIYKSVSALFYRFEFLEAHEKTVEELLKYQEDTLPKQMKDLRDETATISNFQAMLESKNRGMVVETIKRLQNEDCFFASVLFLKEEDRRYLIESIKSINPVFYGAMEDVQKQEITESYVLLGMEELNELSQVEKVYQYEFKVEGNLIRAYLAKTNGNLRFIKMTGDAGNKIKYHTIEESDLFFK